MDSCKRKGAQLNMARRHLMNLNDVPFEASKAGLKTIEVRLNDEKRRVIQAGDTLEFRKTSDGEVLLASVVAVRMYGSLLELTAKEEFNKTGGIYRDRAEWISAINSYYTTEEQERFGLLSLEISLQPGS